MTMTSKGLSAYMWAWLRERKVRKSREECEGRGGMLGRLSPELVTVLCRRARARQVG